VMTVTLSCDHRIIDGVLAGRFLRELKAILEQPLALLL
jgi:pyruvate dehydrogenase E2 component (dihydrolipoamide acetyltransferase)